MESHNALQMARVVVACLIRRGGKYLLVQEALPPAYGLWSLPVGHVDEGETLEVAAIREVREESGYNVKLIKEIALIHESATNAIKHIFSAEIIGGELAPQEGEILDAKWLTYDEVARLHEDRKLRKEWVWDLIERDKSQSESNN